MERKRANGNAMERKRANGRANGSAGMNGKQMPVTKPEAFVKL